MKRIVLVILSVLSIHILSSCSEDSGSGTSPFGGGGGTGGGGVTFTVSTVQGQQGISFNFKPSTNVTVTQVTVRLPAQNFQDVVQGNGTTVFDTQTGFTVGEYTGVQSGQQWTFNIQGKIGNAQGQAYNKDVNFSIP